MRFIFSFFLCMAVISTTFADTQPSCSQYDNNQSDCYNAAGCKWYSEDIDGTIVTSCLQCDLGEYKPEGGGLNCLPCNSTTYTVESGKVALPQNQQSTGQSTCPWTCADGYFEDNDRATCLGCPGQNNWLAGLTTEPYTYITKCACNFDASNGRDVYLIQTQNSYGEYMYYCGNCGAGSPGDLPYTHTNNSINTHQVYTCDCFDGTGANSTNAIPAINKHGNYTVNNSVRLECVCPENSSLNDDNSACICNGNTIPSTDNNNNPICSTCLANAHTVGSTCVCDNGYYGNGTPNRGSSCTKCPAGTTSNNGINPDTTKEVCHVS